MKNICTILLLLLCFQSKAQDEINLCLYGEYSITESNDKFHLKYKNEIIAEQSNSNEFLLRFNIENDLIFINSECINCESKNHKFERRDLTCPNNVRIEIIPLNDSLRIVNDFKLSNTCFNHSMRSKINPECDSLYNGSVLYNGFEFGYSNSTIRSNQKNTFLTIEPALKYYKLFDLIIGIEYNLRLNGQIKSVYFNFFQLENGSFISKGKKEVKYIRTIEDFPFTLINDYSEAIEDYKWLNNSNFGALVGKEWFLCSYEKNGQLVPDINIKENTADSIRTIPFFTPAYIIFYKDSSVLNISHQRIKGKVKFDTLIIKNYFAEGIDPYINKEIIAFTFSKAKHIIVNHSNGYPRYGKFEVFEGPNPLEFFELEVHKLDSIPKNTMIIKNLP